MATKKKAVRKKKAQPEEVSEHCDQFNATLEIRLQIGEELRIYKMDHVCALLFNSLEDHQTVSILGHLEMTPDLLNALQRQTVGDVMRDTKLPRVYKQ